jgi:hypothetical protein
MALAEALDLIDQDWPETEALLSVRTLASVAQLQWAEAEAPEVLAELIVTSVLADLPRDHSAWRALTASSTRFERRTRQPLDELTARVVLRALQTVADPAIVPRAFADLVERAAYDNVRSSGIVVLTSSEGVAPIALDPFRLDNEGAIPTFVFASLDPPSVHEIVVRLHELLDGYRDPVGAASWWLTPNQWLAAAAPAELLGAGRDAELEFAAEQLSNDSW